MILIVDLLPEQPRWNTNGTPVNLLPIMDKGMLEKFRFGREHLPTRKAVKSCRMDTGMFEEVRVPIETFSADFTDILQMDREVVFEVLLGFEPLQAIITADFIHMGLFVIHQLSPRLKNSATNFALFSFHVRDFVPFQVVLGRTNFSADRAPIFVLVAFFVGFEVTKSLQTNFAEVSWLCLVGPCQMFLKIGVFLIRTGAKGTRVSSATL